MRFITMLTFPYVIDDHSLVEFRKCFWPTCLGGLSHAGSGFGIHVVGLLSNDDLGSSTIVQQISDASHTRH